MKTQLTDITTQSVRKLRNILALLTFTFMGLSLPQTQSQIISNSGPLGPFFTGTTSIPLNFRTALRIRVAGLPPTEHDTYNLTVNNNVAGTLQVVRVGGFKLHAGDQITLVNNQARLTTSLDGRFATVQNDFATGTIVKGQIVYFSNSVVLEGIQGSFQGVCPTPNGIAVGRALDSAVGDPRASSLINYLDEEPLAKLCRDFDLIGPEGLNSIYNIGISFANVQTANLDRRMEDIRAGSNGFSASGFALNGSAPSYIGGLAGATGPEGKSGKSVNEPAPDNRWGVFVTGVGEFTNVSSTSNGAGYDLTTGGFTLGVDYRVNPHFAIGFTAGYAHTGADLTNNGYLSVNGGSLGLYTTVFSGGFYFNAAATGGPDGYNTRRTALNGSAYGSTNGGEFNTLAAVGYDWKSGGLSIGPTANFQYTYVGLDGFTENGSLAPLKYPNQNADSIRTAVGMKATYDWKVSHVLIRPELSLAWQHEYANQSYSIISGFANGAGDNFTVYGPQIGRDSMLIGAGFAVLWNDRISTYAYYDGEVARTNYVSNNVSAGVRVTF